MRSLLLVVGTFFVGCSGPSSPAGDPDSGSAFDAGPPSCTPSTCDDAVGTWSVRQPSDGGVTCAPNGGFPRFTVGRSGSALCIAGTVQLAHPAKTAVSSDGGCGFTLRFDEGFVDGALTTVQTYDVNVTGSVFTGAVEVKNQGDGVGTCSGATEGAR